MAEQVATHETVETHQGVPSGHHDDGASALLKINQGLVAWTWVTFVLLCVVLYKFAWKPILAGLDQRERDIKDSLDEAQRVRDEMARIGETQKRLLAETEAEAKEVMAQARKGAGEAARLIEEKARDEAQILVENATREIQAAQEKAQAALRRESADVAVALAGRILGEKLDKAKDRELVDRLLTEL